MASYRQLESAYPYFCQSGPGTDTATNITSISTSNTFWNGGTNLERGSACIVTTGAPGGGLVFTAPVKGLYYFKIILCCINNSAIGADSGNWGFRINKSGTLTNRVIDDKPGNIATTATEYNTQFSTIAFLNVDDTVRMYSTGYIDDEIYLADKCYFMGYLVSGFS